MNLFEWARKHDVSREALNELLGMSVQYARPPKGDDESAVQSAVRLEAARSGVQLFRNNVGVLADKTGRPVRYGLANDSTAVNKVIKSADLIGWRTVHIGQEHVGTYIAQFVSRECKHPGWTWKGSERELAQAAWAALVASAGGDAQFVNGLGSFEK
jgi:hypothetical protein